MSNRIAAIRSGLILLFTTTAMAGCGIDGISAHNSPAGRTDSADLQMESYGMIERDALRIRKDTLRNRLWVLTLDEVRVYDTAKNRKRLIRKIELPNWSVAQFICNPDMVLDSSGSAIISSNVQAMLLLIDADSFELKAREITLREREQWETGFRALTFAADGSLLALASMGGSLWKIDVTNADANMIRLDNPPLDACAFTPQLLNDFERSRQP
jgi:hypothetical protein